MNEARFMFEWSAEKKAQFVLWFAVIITSYALAMLAVLYYVIGPIIGTELFQPRHVAVGMVLATLYTLGCLYFIKYGNRYDGKQRHSELYVISAIAYYVLGNTLMLYYLGFHSLLTGIYVSGSTTVGMLLFGKRVILPITYMSVLLGSSLYALSFVGIIDYSALVPNPGNNHNNIIWLIAASNLAVPHVAAFIFIANVSIERWREREQHAKYLSETDVLTNIANRRHFLDLLQREYRHLQRDGENFSLLMLDLDNFKTVNDSYGHHIGDQLLIATTEAIKGCIRTKDILGRYGGEEFVVLLPNTEAPAALISAERCCERIASKRFSIGADNEISLQVSIGCVTTTATSLQHPPEHLLWLADEALGAAKLAGKNRVVTSSEHERMPDANYRHRFRTS